MGRTAQMAAAGPRVGSTALSPGWAPPIGWPLPVPGWAAPPGWLLPVPGWVAPPGWPLLVESPDGSHRPAGRCRSPGGIHRSVPWVGSTARPAGTHRPAGRCRSPDGSHRPASRCRSPDGLYCSVPRMGRTARWSLPVPGWTILLGPPDGPHRPLVAAGSRLGYTARSPGWAAPPAGRCRSPVGLYHSVPRVGRTARLAATGPRMGRTAHWSLPVPGWAIPLCPPGGPHRSAGRCRSPGWAAPPGWPLLVPSGLHNSARRCRPPGGLACPPGVKKARCKWYRVFTIK